jgi:Fur family ferric uptake transcriptional regulator
MSTYTHVIQNLRDKGFRITPQRELIIKAITRSDHHMSAEEIFDAVGIHTQALNLATIYRTLDLLVEQGLACRNDLGGGCVVYSTIHHGPHIHLVCRLCGDIIDAEYPLIAPLGEQLQEQYAFEADLQHISIFGVCHKCKGGC